MTNEEAEKEFAQAIESGDVIGDCVIVDSSGKEHKPAGAVEIQFEPIEEPTRNA